MRRPITDYNCGLTTATVQVATHDTSVQLPDTEDYILEEQCCHATRASAFSNNVLLFDEAGVGVLIIYIIYMCQLDNLIYCPLSFFNKYSTTHIVH